MRNVPKTLNATGLDSQWHKRLVDIALTDANGQQIRFRGEILQSETGCTHSVEFELRTRVLRNVKVDIPFALNADADIDLLVDDHLVKTFHFRSSGDQAFRVYHLSKNLTRWTVSAAVVRVRLRFFYPVGASATLLFVDADKPEWQARAIERWEWLYALQSVLFFFLVWGAILAIAFVGTTYLLPVRDNLRDYKVVGVLVAWAVAVLGIPDLAKIPVRTWIRRLYGLTWPSVGSGSSSHRKSRCVILVALASLFAACAGPAGVILRCQYIRHHYTMLIRSTIKSDENVDLKSIREAFTLLPWRPEAQFVFERYAHYNRDANAQKDLTAYRGLIRNFTSDPALRQIVVEAVRQQHLPLSLAPSARKDFNPLVWYASILVEGEDYEHSLVLNEAIDLLKSSEEPEVQLERANLQLESLENAALSETTEAKEVELEKKAADKAVELRKLLERYQVELGLTYVYQAGTDTLAGYHLLICELDQAADWYSAEIRSRRGKEESLSQGVAALWGRPPEKFALYYLFVSGSDTMVRGAGARRPPTGWIEDVLDNGQCPFRKTFQEKVFRGYEEFSSPDRWLEGTIVGSKEFNESKEFPKLINESLEMDWRY